MTDDREMRLVAEHPGLVVRSDESGRTVVRGYAALFNSESRDLGGFIEVIERGAFDKVLADPELDVIAKLDHSRPLARTPGTLRLGTDERGLWYEFDPKRSDADVVEALERGDLRGSSFAFRLGKEDDRWEQRSDGVTIRTISNFDGLFDVGPVYTPAYPETESYVSKRAIEAARSFEEHPVLSDPEASEDSDPVQVEDPLASTEDSVGERARQVAKALEARAMASKLVS